MTAIDTHEQLSPLVRRFVRSWHVEPPTTPDGLFRIADAAGHHLLRKFFTAQSAQLYVAQLEGIVR